MPELKHNFIKGRMNLDLDERLVPDGEYRKAMNIEVSTSEGSNVGTVQSVLGNVPASATVAPGGGFVVGSYANEQTNKIYYLVQCDKFGAVTKDLIVEYSDSSGSIPVFVDIHSVEYSIPPGSAFTGSMISVPPTVENQNIRDDMFVISNFEIQSGVSIITTETSGVQYNTNTNTVEVDFGPITVYNTINNTNTGEFEIYFRTKSGIDIPAAIFNWATSIEFVSNPILGFRPNNYVTGINIVEDLLFFTDNFNEPKKINITKSKAGTILSGNSHTKFMVYNENGTIKSQNPATVPNVTVCKPSPLVPPKLEMYRDINARAANTSGANQNVYGVTDFVNFAEKVLDDPATPLTSDFSIVPFAPGTTVDIPFVSTGSVPNFIIGDILLLSRDSGLLLEPQIFQESVVRVVVTGITGNIVHAKIISFSKAEFPFSEDTSGNPDIEWVICLEQAKALFEFKFPRFAYRYKYQDNEYSSFSPFSECAFLPGNFNYDSKNAYNLGMINQIRFLKIIDFVPDGIPDGVTEVDILYKESNSPNIYTVKTIKSTDPEWSNMNTTPQAPWQTNTKGAIQLESEVIYATVPSNQLLRPWDNVPRKALAQELSANRIIYGNYVEGYNMNNNVNLLTYVKSKDLSNELTEYAGSNMGAPSIKSLRTYQVGVVYRDILGRETPVFTNEKASFNIGKGLADDYNTLFVENKTTAPLWADSYKFFIKETSNEYYNLAMDRWYNAEDGGIWLSFPSAERNKVDEDTYLILKKQHDTDTFVEAPARYKIIAIENEAPDFIKLERSSLAVVNEFGNTIVTSSNSVQSSNSSAFDNTSVEKGKSGLVVRLYDSSGASTDWYRVKSFSSDTIFIKGTFGQDLTGASGLFSGVPIIELAQEVFHTKPEFQGRFFVKIAEDGDLLTAIDTGATNETSNFKIKYTQKQYFIKSNGQDNAWSRKDQWRSGWEDTIGTGFYIDQADRDWGSIPGGPGPWPRDVGMGITGTRGGAVSNHMELSLSRINDGTYEGFSIAAHDKAERDFYDAMHTKTTWVRWKEDPNGLIYEITKTLGKGDTTYDNYHSSDRTNIFNYDGGTANNVRSWKSNKTTRLYIKLKATGYRKDVTGAVLTAGEYLYDSNIDGFEPTWISDDIHNNADPGLGAWTSQHPTLSNGWDPTTGTSGISKEQPSRNGNNPNYFSVNTANNNSSSSTYVTAGMNCNVQTGANFYNTIEVVEKYDIDKLKPMSTNPAIFETEPKEDIGLDLYYEIDQAFPMEIRGKTNEIFAKIGSEVEVDYPGALLEKWQTLTPGTPYTAIVTNGITKITLNQNAHPWIKPGYIIGDATFLATYFPSATEDVVVSGVSGFDVFLSANAEATTTTPVNVTFTKRSKPKIKSWDDNVCTLDCKVVNPASGNGQTSTGFVSDNVNLPIAMGSTPNSLKFNRVGGGTITGTIFNAGFTSILDGAELNPNGYLKLKLNRDSSNPKIDLNWYNCYSFGNGVESDRIRDDFNAVTMGKGVKASTTLAMKYQEERKSSSLIYSGIYNNASGVNNTNQFIMAEKITKDLNPRHGSIQKLHAREGDLLTLCEDKVFKILSNKDALYNADGNPQMISTNNVLGQATPMGGEYGISKNPESFAFQAYKAYFSDKSRGVILKVDGQGLVPISDHGMKDYFADNLKNASKIIGSYDDKKDSYNVTLAGVNHTISYGERTNGWTSFKSFMQESGLSLNNVYYTFKFGDIWEHHQGVTASFYGLRTDPYVNVLFNQLPGSVKSFGSLNYEGSKAQVTQNIIDGEYNNNLASLGWYVRGGNTDLQQTDVLEFKNKEGKWFSRMKGEAYNPSNIDLTEFSFQGIDMASSVVEGEIIGCGDPAALNYDPLANADCDGIVGGSNNDCCCYDYGCTDSQPGLYPAENGFDRFGSPCTFPCQDSDGNPIGFAADNYDPKYDCCPPGGGPCCNYPANVYGCTDPLAFNYFVGANFDDGSCCYDGCTDSTANNYSPTACNDDGSCTYDLPCEQGVIYGEAMPGTGMYPNINTFGTDPYLSNSNHAVIDLSGGYSGYSIATGCQIASSYLGTGYYTITNIIGNDVYLSAAFNNAPTPAGQLANGLPDSEYLELYFWCGNCNVFFITVSDLSDVDDVDWANNPYTVTTDNLGTFTAGTGIAPASEIAFLTITPESGQIIQASNFHISGSTISTTTPPTFVGGSLPAEVHSVIFQDTENPVYINYTPTSSTFNNAYDPSAGWQPTANNEVEVIVLLNGFIMPSNNLDIKIDIDGYVNDQNELSDITI